MDHVKHIFRLFWLAVALFAASAASAASLEKIEVNSRLGEPFFAEVPLSLDANELVSKVFVEIAASSDYKIFEVYRDPSVSAIRADVESDARGARVKLSSRTAIKAPFFNLIVKIRHGRVAHFKKYAVFLEAPKTVLEAAEKEPVPTVNEVATLDAVEESKPEVESAPVVKHFDGWARTGRYGPIVRGDMLSTVAQRLRVDKRYTMPQVMAALYKKNSSSFDKGNMNLLMKGRYLDVPTASEVESISAGDASNLFAEHEKQWRELNQQPRYAAEAEAQRTRYSKRVRMGEQADGVASAPTVAAAEISSTTDDATEQSATAATDDVAENGSAAAEEAAPVVDDSTRAMLEELQKQNALLQQKLEQSEQSIAALSQKVDLAASAASDANVKRLEILMARMQGELEKAQANVARQQVAGMDWVVWLLIALVVILLIVVVLLMRREPAHPADAVETAVADEAAAASEVPQPVEAASAVAEEKPATKPVVAAVEEDIFEQVDADQPGEETPDLFDSISTFGDDLTDTDTAEMVPFDPSSMEEADPNIDYLSEADVYIRYGMEEEALHQLDLALRLNPEHVDAHIRKAELMHGKGDSAGFSAATAAALAVLSGVALDQYNSAVAGFAPVEAEGEAADAVESETAVADDLSVAPEASEDELDYDLLGVADADDTVIALSDEESDQLNIEDESEQLQPADESDFAEMDWLHDASFEDEVDAGDDDSVGGETIALSADDGATQVIDSILDEFEDDQDKDISLEGDSIDTDLIAKDDVAESETTLDLAEVGATQELDNLLNAFSEETESAVASPADSDDADETIEKEMTATQHLDNLLGEFSDDDNMFAGDEELIAPVQPEGDTAATEEEEEIFGATQHLDVLMGEFAGNEEELVAQNLPDATAPEAEPAENKPEADHGATQQLDHLLGEFLSEEASAADNDFEGLSFEKSEPSGEAIDEIEVDHCATQELDHLLSSFADDDDEDDDNKSS